MKHQIVIPQKQISLLNRANISTIHSFCLNMIKNNFYLLDMANFRIGIIKIQNIKARCNRKNI